MATIQQSALKSQLPAPTSRREVGYTATSTVLLIPTSMPSYYGATLNMTTSFVQQSPGVPSSQQLSPTRKVSSPLLHNPHATFSDTEGR